MGLGLTLTREYADEFLFSLYTILSRPTWYGVWLTKKGSEGGRTVRNDHSMVLKGVNPLVPPNTYIYTADKQAVGCGVCDTPELWRGAAGLCAPIRACWFCRIHIHT